MTVMNIRRPGDRCPDCGEPMKMLAAPCPDGRLGCGVAHSELACLACRQRQWDEHDRPATIGELKELDARLSRLIDGAAS